MNWLLATVLLPLVGIALIWVFGDSSRGPARAIALVISILTLLMAAGIVHSYVKHHDAAAVAAAANESIDMSDSFADSGSKVPLDRGTPSFDRPWIHAYGVEVRFSLALDGLSVWLFGLSALLVLTSVLVSWEAIDDRAPTFYALLLLLESGMLGVFAAHDVILFYVFFEFTLIPLFFLIGIWGHEDRRYAAAKFFLFTLAGSLLTFLGLLAIVLWNFYHASEGVLDFSFEGVTAALATDPIPPSLQLWIFLALFAGFAVKVPLFPVHTWLPLAHTQAPRRAACCWRASC